MSAAAASNAVTFPSHLPSDLVIHYADKDFHIHKFVLRIYPADIKAFFNALKQQSIIAGLSMADGISSRNTLVGGEIFTSSYHFRDEVVRVLTMIGHTVIWSVHMEIGESAPPLKESGKIITAKHTSWAVKFTTQPHDTKLTASDVSHRPSLYTGRLWSVAVPEAEQRVMVRSVLERDWEGRVRSVSRPVMVSGSVCSTA